MHGFRAHIAAARETGLPLVIHAREATRMWRISCATRRKGRLPGGTPCFTGGRELAFTGIELGALRVVHRHPDIQEIRRSSRHCQGLAGRPHPVRDGFALSRAWKIAWQTLRAGLCGRDGPGVGRDARLVAPGDEIIARQTTENFFGCSARCRGHLRWRHDVSLHHSRLRIVHGRAAAGARFGVPAIEQSEEPPAADLAAGRATRAERITPGSLVDTSPDLREQLLDANVDWLDGVLITHEHADHIHGIDVLRALFVRKRRRVDYVPQRGDVGAAAGALRLIASKARPAATYPRW